MLDTREIRGDSLYFEPKSRSTIEALCDEIDRLREEKQTPQGKMVRVKFQAFVDPYGNIEIPRLNVNAVGRDSQAEPSFEGSVVNITADLPVPKEVEVVAEVENG